MSFVEQDPVSLQLSISSAIDNSSKYIAITARRVLICHACFSVASLAADLSISIAGSLVPINSAVTMFGISSLRVCSTIEL